MLVLGGVIVYEQKNKVSVQIYGQTYQIIGTESVAHMRLVASMVDEKMKEIAKQNPSLNTTKLAVLTAVNAVHEYLKQGDKIEQLEQANNQKD